MEYVDALLSAARDFPGGVPAAAACVVVVALALKVLFGSERTPPRLDVAPPAEIGDGWKAEATWTPGAKFPADRIPCYDPGTLEVLGTAPVMSPAQVTDVCRRAAAAQKEWAKSSFAQRRLLLRTIQRFVLENQEAICKVSARDSGKPMVDAAFGEVMVTLEKIAWTCAEGEKWLAPERRSAGRMMFYKSARVEYHPLGVVGAIVPWNYPFHNVFNPLISNVFAGNALVVKVSEYASWSPAYYGKVIKEALKAAGAPEDLVQIVTGYGATGNALVTSDDVAKVVFVGSTGVGKMVMKAAADKLKPVVLELGGKDPFIVMEDADLNVVVPTALRGAYQSAGQNCAGAERFFVHAKIYDKFCDLAAATTKQMRQGWALSPEGVDIGAMCMPQQPAYIQGLIDDAVAKGARVLAGGALPADGTGQFYPPTVIADITPDMRIAVEEVFGPVLAVARVADDDEAVARANDCPFGLGSNVFCGSQGRARRMVSRLHAGMGCVNDFATTYMAQSLPFGGVKDSGFDRFAGIEGLRGCCYPKAVVEDALPFIKTEIPPPLRYPVQAIAFDFIRGIIGMFYGMSLAERAGALVTIAQCFVAPSTLKKAKKA